MGGYKPLKITGNQTGLVQSREEFLLPDDAYPILENAFVWRERIKRKQGYELLGRLQRCFTDVNVGISPGGGPNAANYLVESGYVESITIGVSPTVTTKYPHNLVNGNTIIFTGVGGVTGINDLGLTVTSIVDDLNFVVNATTGGAYTSGGFWFSNQPLTGEPNAELIPGTLVLTLHDAPPIIFTDQGDGTLTSPTSGNTATINYVTGVAMITTTAPALTRGSASFCYAPGFPVMGLRSKELNNINNEQLIAFDQKYAYTYTTQFEEYIPGYIWTGNDSDFFWSTNYWVGDNNLKIFWVTNFSGVLGDPIRYTNGVDWVNFAPIIDASSNRLQQCLAILPFRGRLVTFNTFEGTTLAGSTQYRQRIRWAAIGNPFTETSSIVTTISATAWRDDIPGKGGFLDIPTSENITAVGFVRDNLVIYCENSTWQLRYTGRSIAPFQIEKVNTELGAESTFSAVQFDTSLVGIGNKGIVECDSFKSDRIDIKIPDLIFYFTNTTNGTKRVHGVRDFQQRLAFWTYPFNSDNELTPTFPNRRLVYNYENDSWAIFTDSLTTLGTYQPQSGRRWSESTIAWQDANFPWINRPAEFPSIIGGNQQGFVEYLDSKTTNDISLSITDITADGSNVTSIEIVNHNLATFDVIKIKDIAGTVGNNYIDLNDQIFGVVPVDADHVQLWEFNALTGSFDIPNIHAAQTYIGGGKVAIRDGFSIVSKKFNFLDDGQNIQLGFIDVLMNNTENGAISLNVYVDYNDSQPTNTFPQNSISTTADTFFNTTVPTYVQVNRGSSKNWQRVFCATRAAFITLEWTLSNAQLVGEEQEEDVQIDAQILWIRQAGNQLPIGV